MFTMKTICFFCNFYDSTEDFPKIRDHSKMNTAYIGNTYRFKQFFSLMKLIKTEFRSKLTDTNLINQMRIAQSTIHADINKHEGMSDTSLIIFFYVSIYLQI